MVGFMKIRLQFLIFLVVLCGLAMPGFGAVQMFLQIDGIDGESLVEGHANQIDVVGFAFSIAQRGLTLAGSTGAGASKSDFKTLTIYKDIDKATPPLMLACALGKMPTIHPTATLYFVDPLREINTLFFKIVMSDVLITSFNESDSDGSDRPLESISLSFSKIQFVYTPNQAGPPSSVSGFDVIANKALLFNNNP